MIKSKIKKKKVQKDKLSGRKGLVKNSNKIINRKLEKELLKKKVNHQSFGTI